MPFFEELTYRSDTATDFHAWWLRRRGLAQGCAFFGNFSHCSPFRGSKPSKPNFVAWIGVFKPNSRNKKRAYYQNYCIDSNQILHSDKDHQMPFVGGPPTPITNPRWRTAAIFEKSPYLGRSSTNFDEIWHGEAFRTRHAIHESSYASFCG